MPILVRDVMTKDVITLKPDMLFNDAIEILISNGISGAPVVNEDGSLIGLISEKDFLPQIFPNEKEFYENVEYYLADYQRIANEAIKVLKMQVGELMRTSVYTIAPDNYITTAIAKMTAHKIRRLPVVEKDKMVGIISTNDVYKKFISILGKQHIH